MRTLSRGNSADVLIRPEVKSRTSEQSPCHGGGSAGWGAGEGRLEKDLSEFKVGEARGTAPRARGCGVAAAASLSGDLAVVFIDSLCRSAAESRPAAPAPANQSMLNLFIWIITEERRALSH